MVQTALFHGKDRRADEMQLDCISETLMRALFYASCFYWALERGQIGVLM